MPDAKVRDQLVPDPRGTQYPYTSTPATALLPTRAPQRTAGYLMASTTRQQMLRRQARTQQRLYGRCGEPGFSLLFCTHRQLISLRYM